MKSNNKEIGFGKLSILKVFEGWYTVPSYQRHYVWDTDNVNDLLSDFTDNYEEHSNEEYFLGSYIIQNKHDSDDLLDGQQRITTLFLLFAFLRDYERSSEVISDTCQNLVYQQGNPLKKTISRLRLTYEIRGNVKKFVEDYLMDPGSISKNWDYIKTMSESKQECMSIQRMCNTLCCYKEYFDDHKEIDLNKFMTFILNNVVMIYISADSLEDAFRLFSVMNDRGQKLSNADILKSSNLEKISDPNDVNYYAKEWENMQEDLGSDFDRFFSYIRAMILKSRQKSTMLDEFEKYIFQPGLLNRGKDFFDYVFKAYKDYNKIINLIDNPSTEYCSLIRIMLNCMPSADWIPIVMFYYRKFGSRGIIQFAEKIACKNIGDAVCGQSPTKRRDNLNNILLLIDQSDDYKKVLDSEIHFSFSHHLFMANIQSDIYGRRYAYSLLMLLEYKYKDKSEWKEFGTVSIEHILPQNPSSTSKWCKDFTPDQRAYYTHKLGNLCLIGRRKNSSLGNLDYKEKIDRYFSKNIGSFANTQKIYKSFPYQWTPKEVEENHQRVIKDLMEIFNIKDASTSIQVMQESRPPIEVSSIPQNYIEKQRLTHPNAYAPWTEEDDQKLMSLFSSGYTKEQLMQYFGRNEGSIRSRVNKLFGPNTLR